MASFATEVAVDVVEDIVVEVVLALAELTFTFVVVVLAFAATIVVALRRLVVVVVLLVVLLVVVLPLLSFSFVVLASRKRCDFEIAKTLRFAIADEKNAAIFF